MIALPLLSLALTILVWKLSTRAARFRNLILLGVLTFIVFSLAACGANWVSTAQEIAATIAGLEPLAASVVSQLAPGEAQAVATASTEAEAGLNLLASTIKEYNSQPNDTTLAKVQDVANTVHDNLASIEAVAAVKDPTTAKKINGVVAAAVAGVSVLEANILQKHPATVAAAQNAQQS